MELAGARAGFLGTPIPAGYNRVMEPNPYEAPRECKAANVPAGGVESALFSVGIVAMLAALFFQNVTLASNSYGVTLILAAALTATADLCLAVVAWRGSPAFRLVALAAMLPTIFVVADLIRRAPHAF